jgi:glycosyltransferase involved in cell wall biosynthesis
MSHDPRPDESTAPLAGSLDEAGALRRRVGQLEVELQQRRADVDRLQEAVLSQQRTIARMEGTFAWQLATRAWNVRDRLIDSSPLLRRAYQAGIGRLKLLVRTRLPRVRALGFAGDAYDAWVARHAATAADLARLRTRAARLTPPTLFTVVVPVHDISEGLLRRCLDSVRVQAWENWELRVVDDGSQAPHVWRTIEEYARSDARIHADRLPTSGGIVAATARALEMARGDFVAFLDHDDELAPEALLAVAAKLADEPDLDLVYSDEDKLDEGGRRVEPFFKPEWSPDLLLSMNYMSHLTVIRRSLVEGLGGLRPGFDGSQDYDLLLRATERTGRVGHVPRVLYHWRKTPGSEAAVRGVKAYAYASGKRALEEALVRRGARGRVETSMPGVYGVRYEIRGQPTVSIVIPTRDRPGLLRACVRSIEEQTTWRSWELLVVDNGSSSPGALRLLAEVGRRHTVVRDPRPFNWSALNNAAARRAHGELLLFMNDDMEVLARDWLEALIEHAQRPEVGAVGAKLLYPDGAIQHAGVVVGVGAVAGHAFKGSPGDAATYARLAHVVRDVSAVTGACMMVRRETFDALGGFDEELPVAYNDIDFCLRLRKAGRLVVYTPFATLRHHESATRGALDPPDDAARMRARWHDVLMDDPYYSPHLTRDREDYGLRA